MTAMVRRLAIGLGLLGALLLAQGRPWEAQAVWLLSNAGLVVVNWQARQRGQAGLFLAYLLLAAWGIAPQP